MKNLLKVTIILMSLIFSVSSYAQVNDGDKTILPFLKKGYRPQIGIAPVAGLQKTKNVDDLDFVYGVEISLQCPLYQCKKNHIRQQLSIVNTKRDGFSAWAFELAPHYKLPIASDAEFGVGPHIGYQTNKITLLDTDFTSGVFPYGLGGSLDYAFKSIFIGVDARYVWTTKPEYNNIKTESMDDFRTLAKIGFKF